MQIFCLLLIACLPLQVFAISSKDCEELRSEQIRLSLTASNLANVNTTRTPEGGPYRPYIIKSCSNGGCAANKSHATSLMKYLPDHPDADMNGYVAYPNLDEKSEYATFNMTVAKLKLLVSAKACASTILTDNGNSSFALRYGGKGDPYVKQDIFNLTNNHEVISWMRQDSKGRATTISFAAGGEVVSHSQSE